jgi:predicted transposase/invertase (TIGR01784 family)
MVPGIDPRVDYAFKRLFGRESNEALAIHLLNAVLMPAPSDCIVSLDLLNPFNDKDTLDDKLSILDIKARDQSGRQFNVEMQLLASEYFSQRVLYYWARLHQSQLREGEPYNLLRPTISICFVSTPLFPKVAAYHLVFELRERDQQLRFADDLAVHLLELSKFTKSAEESASPLDVWLYFLRHAPELDTEMLPAALAAVEEVRRAMGELEMIARSDLERERYEARMKLQQDFATALVEGDEKGQKKQLVKRLHFCERLLQRAETPAEQLLARSLEDLERLAQELEAEVTRPPAPPSDTRPGGSA